MDTAPEITQAINQALAEAGLPLVTLEQAHLWVGKGAAHFLEQALCHFQLDKTVDANLLLQRFYYFYERCSGTNSQLYPAAKATVVRLHELNKRQAVLTNKFKVGADLALKAHGLFDYFADVLGGDTFAEKKPSPVGVHYLLDKYQLKPEQVLYLGDSKNDVATARAAGVTIWLLPHGYNHGEPLAASQPDRILSGFEQLLKDL